MARVFISFFNAIQDSQNSSAMPCFYEGFIRELVNNGNQVLCFGNTNWEQNFQNPKKKFIKLLKSFNPDLMILFNNSCYDLSNHFDCPIVIWEADSYLYYFNKESLKKNPNRYKFIVAQSVEQKLVADFFGVKKENVFFLPFSTAIEAKRVIQDTNISFIGSNYRFSKMFSKFMMMNPNEQEINQYKQLLKKMEDNPFITREKALESIGVKSEIIKNNFSFNDVLSDISATARIQSLSAVSNLGLKLYGSQSWIKIAYHPELILSYQNKKIYSLKDNQNIYNRSKIGININHIQAQSGFSWRVCDIMASNACLVTEPKSDLKLLFPSIKIPVFNNPYEARETCKLLLKDDSYRKEIVNQSNEVINNNYLFSHRLNDLTQILDINLKNVGARGSLEYFSEINKMQIIKEKIDEQWRAIGSGKFYVKSKLMINGAKLIANQIPLINTKFNSRDEIIEKINAIIDFDETSKH